MSDKDRKSNVSLVDRIKGWRVPILTGLGLLFALAVAGVTGKMSWGHIVHVGRLVAEPDAGILPVAVDGMMLTGAVMGAVDRLRGMKVRGWAIISLWLGSVLTLTFNVASAWERGVWAMIVAAIPAATMLVAVEVIFHPSRRVMEAVRGQRWWSRKPTQTAAKTIDAPEPAPPTPTPVVTPEPPVQPARASRPPRPRATVAEKDAATRKPRAGTPGAARGENTRPRTRKVAQDEPSAGSTPEPMAGPTMRPRPLAIEAQAVRVVDPSLTAAFSG